jgi:hypothetical protein
MPTPPPPLYAAADTIAVARVSTCTAVAHESTATVAAVACESPRRHRRHRRRRL